MSLTLAALGTIALKGLALTGAMTAARTVGGAISGITSRIMPFKGSGDSKRMDYQASINRQQQEYNNLFQERLQTQLQERGFQDERDIWFKGHSARHLWLENINESREIDKVKVSTRIRQAHLQDIYHVEKKRVSTLGLKVFYLVISLLIGCLVWFCTDIYFSPSTQDYLSFPLKWFAFPLLATVLTYTFYLPRISQAKEKKMQELIRAVTEEVGALGSELLLLMQPPKE